MRRVSMVVFKPALCQTVKLEPFCSFVHFAFPTKNVCRFGSVVGEWAFYLFPVQVQVYTVQV